MKHSERIKLFGGTETILFSDDAGSGSPVATRTTAPDVAAGDAQFFVDDPKRPLQLRPVLASEGLPGRPVQRGEWVLVALFSYPQMRAFVRLPPHLRKNDRRGVLAAIKRVERVSPEAAAIFRGALTVPRGVIGSGVIPFVRDPPSAP